MDIEEYIVGKYDTVRGNQINNKIKQIYKDLNRYCENESEDRKKTMQTKILPRVAMYQALMESFSQKEAYDAVWDYTKNCICAKTRKKYGRLEKIPFFFPLYKNAFLHIIGTSDKWKTKQTAKESHKFGFEIHQCLWYDTCVKCGCPELCKVFCDSDWENFGDMKKTSFERTQTLGTGGTMCDFVFRKIRK